MTAPSITGGPASGSSPTAIGAPGAVQLVEIPTDDEIHDNIVAYWRPDGDIKSGDSLSFDYRLYWQDSEPAYPKNIARVVATRMGRRRHTGPDPCAARQAQIRGRFHRRPA